MVLTDAGKRLRQAGKILAGLILCCAGLARSPLRAEVPEFEAAVSGSYAGDADADGTPTAAPVRGSESFQIVAEHRWILRGPNFFGSVGVQADNYFFAGHPQPSRLQDYAATFALQYFINGENVAALSLRPGFYFERKFTAKAWDVPVDFFSGVPIAGKFTGVVGASNARFYHHALPILGIVWNGDRHWRVEAIYPEPALVYSLDAQRGLRLGGRLTGGGFLSDARPRRTAIEYECYRVGLEWSQACAPGSKVALEAGWEADRNFDFFRTQGRARRSGAVFVQVSLTEAR